jgi:alcohol dehydrogenase, propanol-preferring
MVLTAEQMRAMVLENSGAALREKVLTIPRPQSRSVLVRITACAVCRTDLHVIDGELPKR